MMNDVESIKKMIIKVENGATLTVSTDGLKEALDK